MRIGVGYRAQQIWGVTVSSDITLFRWQWSFLSSFMKTVTRSLYHRSLKTEMSGCTHHVGDVFYTAKEQ